MRERAARAAALHAGSKPAPHMPALAHPAAVAAAAALLPAPPARVPPWLSALQEHAGIRGCFVWRHRGQRHAGCAAVRGEGGRQRARHAGRVPPVRRARCASSMRGSCLLHDRGGSTGSSACSDVLLCTCVHAPRSTPPIRCHNNTPAPHALLSRPHLLFPAPASLQPACCRVLSPGCCLVLVTYGEPSSRLPLLLAPGLSWQVALYVLTKDGEAEPGGASRPPLVQGPYDAAKLVRPAA